MPRGLGEGLPGVGSVHLVTLTFPSANACAALEMVQKQEDVPVGLGAYLVLEYVPGSLALKEMAPSLLNGSRVTQLSFTDTP